MTQENQIEELKGQVRALIHTCTTLLMMNPYKGQIKPTLEQLIKVVEAQSPEEAKDIAYNKGLKEVAETLLQTTDAAMHAELLHELLASKQKH